MKLDSIQLTSGEQIVVSPGVTAIVGPNNVGKSTLLRELSVWFSSQPQFHLQTRLSMKVVEGTQVDFGAGVEELKLELSKSFSQRPAGVYAEGTFAEPTYRFSDGQVLLDSNIATLFGGQLGMAALANYFSVLLNADGRLNLAGDTSAYDAAVIGPSNPVQKLWADRTLEKQLSALTVRAFGTPIVVHRYAGSVIRIHVGFPKSKETAPPVSERYLSELNALPTLNAQGDGFRAFVGMVLSVIAGSHPLVLIDEPEAFLHPPQARLFGEFLSQQHLNGIQVIVSTHSEDIIAGLTSAGASGPVSIVRLTRDDAGNHAAQLNATAVQELYTDTLIKYYDMLNGLFAPGVIVCEADSDCTYYRAVLDAREAQTSTRSGVHFTQCGGKARIHVAVSAFQAAKVPVAAIVDIDILQNESEFERLVSSAGGDLAELRPLRNSVVSAIEAKSTKPTRDRAASQIEKIFANLKTDEITPAAASKVGAAVKAPSRWSDFKTSGRVLLSGGVLQAFDALDARLKSLGIFVVTVGELERFHPDVPGSNKAEWLRFVLASNRFENATSATALLNDVMSFISSNQS